MELKCYNCGIEMDILSHVAGGGYCLPCRNITLAGKKDTDVGKDEEE